LHNAAWDAIDYWLFATMACEYSYMNLIRLGWTPEKARVVLPLDTHTELIHTAFIDDWKHFLDLRYHEKTGKAHPDAKILAGEVYAQLKKLHYL
jgi:thymidylate synthase (FAD)